MCEVKYIDKANNHLSDVVNPGPDSEFVYIANERSHTRISYRMDQ